MPPTSETRRITVKVDAPGVKEALDSIQRSMGGLNKSVKSLSTNFGFLTSAVKGWLGYISVREIGSMSDAFLSLQNQLKNTVGPGENAADVFDRISRLASENFLSLKTAGDAYNRFSIALSSSKATAGEVLDLVDTLAKTFRVAGSTAEETANATVQLSQAFSLGVLRGQDLKSVVSQNVVLSKALQDAYGGRLFKEAEKGTLTITEVLKVLIKLQAEVTKKAQGMGQTFGQSLTNAYKDISVAVGRLSTKLEIQDKFAKSVKFLSENINGLVAILGGAAFGLAVSNVIKMGEALKTAFAAGSASALLNPWVLGFTLLAGAAIYLAANWDKVRIQFLLVSSAISSTLGSISIGIADFIEKAAKLAGIKGFEEYTNGLREYGKALKKDSVETAKEYENAKKKAKELEGNLASLTNKVKANNKPFKDYQTQIRELSDQYEASTITLYKFIDGLNAIKKANKDQKVNIVSIVNKSVEEGILRLSEQLREGKITLKSYQDGVDNFQIDKFRLELEAGKITIYEFNDALVKMQSNANDIGLGMKAGVGDFIESTGTLAQGVARVTSQAFEHLSDTLTDFVETGKFQFADFTKAVLHDLNAMIIRAAIVRPIAQGILGAFGGGGGIGAATLSGGPAATPNLAFAANGGVMTSGGMMPLHRYATGGVANTPQMAVFGEGRTPEAYVPLPDGRNIPVKMEGSSGISVVQTVNIYGDGSSTSSDKSNGQTGKQLSDIMKKVAIDTIIQQRRPGGILA